MKRISIIFCCFLLLFSFLSVSALADENPYQPSAKECQELINKFIEKTKFIDGHKDYEFAMYCWDDIIYKQSFIQYGGTEAEWDSMSKYEKACYFLITILPRTFALSKNNAYFMESKQEFFRQAEMNIGLFEKAEGKDIVVEAIYEVWDWHWNNWVNHADFYNPYDYVMQKQPITTTTTSKTTTESDKNTATTSVVNSNGVKSFPAIIKGHLITFVLFLITGGVLLFVIMRNRRRNIDID